MTFTFRNAGRLLTLPDSPNHVSLGSESSFVGGVSVGAVCVSVVTPGTRCDMPPGVCECVAGCVGVWVVVASRSVRQRHVRERGAVHRPCLQQRQRVRRGLPPPRRVLPSAHTRRGHVLRQVR